MDNEYLAHHGIKGQKWGVRRFQNPDGTRTALGKSRSMSIKDRIKARSEQKAEARAVKKAASAEEQHEKLRQQVIRHPKDLYKNKDKFSKSEIESIIKDIEFDRKVKDVRTEELKRGLDAYNRLKDATVTTYQFLNNAKDAYNVIADIHNSRIDAGKASGKRMTRIGVGEQKKSGESSPSKQPASQPSKKDTASSESKKSEPKPSSENSNTNQKSSAPLPKSVFDVPMSVLGSDGNYYTYW